MRRTLRLGLACLPLLGLPLASCSTMGAFEATVRAQNADTLVSVYLVVAELPQLDGWEDSDTIFDRLLQPSVQSEYQVYAQFESEKQGDQYKLREITHSPTSELVEVYRNAEWTELYVEIDRGVLEVMDNPAVLFVADFGAEGFDAGLVKAKELQNQSGAEIMLQRGSLKIGKTG